MEKNINQPLPRPTQELYKELEMIKSLMNTGHSSAYEDRFLEIMNNYDWSVEVFCHNGKYGIKNWDDSLLLPPLFENFRKNSYAILEMGDRIVAMMNGKEGVAILNGKEWTWLLEPEFDYISYPNNLVAVKKDKYWGILNLSTKSYLVDVVLDEVYLHQGFLLVNGIGIFRKEGKYGLINSHDEITKPEFEEIEMEFEGLLRVRMGNQWGYITEEGVFTENEDEAYWCWDI